MNNFGRFKRINFILLACIYTPFWSVMHQNTNIMSEVEQLKSYIKTFCPEVPIENLTEDLQLEGDTEIDWEDMFATYVDSIKDLATKDIVEN